MSIETEHDLKKLRDVGKLVASTIRLMRSHAGPGITTGELDALARHHFESFGARSAPELDYGFPGATCISVNHEVAHGIPGNRIIEKGDMVNFDVSLELDGYYADAGYTAVIEPGPTHRAKTRLCTTSREILIRTINSITAGDLINKIGYSIESLAKGHGYTVIKNLAGHGTGRKLHEEPENILNYGDRSDTRKLAAGTVLAIETFISTGAQYVREDSDGWTLRCPDRSLVSQFEHTIVVTGDRAIVLTE